MSRSTNQAKALIDAWFILLRYKWRFIFPLFIVSSAILAVALLLPRKYKAETIFDRRTDKILSTIMVGTEAKSYQQHKAGLKQEIAGSPALDQAIIDLKPYLSARIKMGGPQTNLAELRRDLQRKVTVQFDIASKEHERVRVTYIGKDPVISRLIVNLLVRNYIQQARVEIENGMSDAQVFFTQQVQTTRQRIDELENQKLTYEIKHTELLPDNPNGIYSMQAQLDEQIEQLKHQKQALASLITSTTQSLATTPDTIHSFTKERNPQLVEMQARLRNLQDEYRTYTIVNKMTLNHPDLVDLKNQVAQLKTQIQNTETEVITSTRYEKNPKQAELALLLNKAQTDLLGVEEELATDQNKRKLLTAKTANLFPIRSQYRKTSRQIDQLGREVTFWEDNLRRVQMAMSAESGNRGVKLSVVRPCPKLYHPASPNMVQVMICAIGLGLMAGAVSLLFAHRTDETFHDGEQLAKAVDLPLIGAISEIVSVQHRRMRNIRNMVIYPLNALAMATVLVALVSVLYLNLKRPTLYDQFKQHPVNFMQQQLDKSEPQTTEPQTAK